MKAWLAREWCEPEAMELAEVPMLKPGPGEVVIANRAAALNFFDILLIQGKYQVRPPLPCTPGNEVAGVIEAVGEGVTRFAPGDRVQAIVSTGGYATHSRAPAAKTFPIPDSMSFEQAAGMIVVYQTSWFALTRRTSVKPGEWLLVHAGAGGVGSSAVQIGKALGARVIATAGSDEKLAFCLEQGAEAAFNYSNRDGADEFDWVNCVKAITGGRGADIIYDPVGGEIFDLSTKCIAPEGRLLVIGFAGGTIPKIAANRVLLKDMSLVGVFWGSYVERYPEALADMQRELMEMYSAGRINPVVTGVWPLDQAPAAMRDLASRRTTGKVVLAI
ncbi:MAG: NADPH:quinone oxidoreductase family protein [Acidobacteria bacterium]|nr:NADPH:quinone oxidoreductase family protein [Acidobacteriota bacterium]